MTQAAPGPLDERERDEATALLAYAFPEIADLPGRVAGWSLDRMFAVRHNGQLAAVILWRLERVHTPVADTPIALCGPGGTRPDLRRRGLLAQAQPQFLQQLREAGCVFAGLETPIARWHRRNGWGLSAAVVRYRCPPDALRPVINSVINSDRGAVQLGGATTQLPDLYRAEGRRRFGLLVRASAHWQALLSRPSRHWAVWRGHEGNAGGYLLYHQEVLPGETVPQLVIDEFITRDADAYLSLLGYLAEHPNVAKVRWDAPQDDTLLSVVREPRMVEPQLCVDKMVRVLDLQRAATLVPATTQTVELALQLQDPQIPQHEGDWLIRIVDGIPTSERLRATASRTFRPKLQITASVLAPLLTGYLTGEAALASGLARASDAASAEAISLLFPPRPPPYAVEPW